MKTQERYFFTAYCAWQGDSIWSHGNGWIKYNDSEENLIWALKEAAAEIAEVKPSQATLLSYHEITKKQYEVILRESEQGS